MDKKIKERIAAINSGIIPEGYKKTKVGIVPVEWEINILGKYIVEHTEKSTENNQYPVLTSSRKGIFLQSDYYNKQVASEDNTGYNVVPFGYFTYRHMSDDEIFRFNINNIVEKGIVSTLYPVFTTKNLDNNWLLNTLNYGSSFQKYALIQKQGGSRTYMYLEKLRKLKLAIPPLPEQQKIAEILSTQDKLIELQEKKIEQLKELKKAYLQKMFPQKGSKYPELRFKGFTEPWEQRKLGDFGTIQTCKRIFKEQTSENGEIPFYKNGTIGLKADAYISREIFEEYRKLYPYPEKGDILISAVGSVGRTAEYTGEDEYFQDSNVVWLKTDGSVEKKYLKAFYQVIDWLIEGSTVKHLYNDNIMRSKITMPNDKIEQRKIGIFFEDFDTLITLHQRKSEQEKQKKKALMQLLLTGIVRTKLIQ